MGVDPPAPFHPTATRRVRTSGMDVIIVPIIVLLPSTSSSNVTTPTTTTTNYTKKICIQEIDNTESGEHIVSTPKQLKLEMYETWENCTNRILHDEMKLLPFVQYSSNTENVITSTNTTIEFLHAINDIDTVNQSHKILVYMLVKITDDAAVLQEQEEQTSVPNQIRRREWNFVDVIELQSQSYNLPDSFDPYFLHILQDILPSKCL